MWPAPALLRLSLTTVFLVVIPFTDLSRTVSTAVTVATTPMSLSLDDVDQKCNELMEKAALGDSLSVEPKRDSSIEITMMEGDWGPDDYVTFPVASPVIAPEVHRRVFSTLARIVGRNGLSNVSYLTVLLPRGDDGYYYEKTTEMAPFLQSITETSTIHWLRISVSEEFCGSDSSVDTEQSENTTELPDVFCLVRAVATNLTLPQSALRTVVFEEIWFDNDLLTILCEAITSRECQLVELRICECAFPTLGPLWSAMSLNQSIQTMWVDDPESFDANPEDIYESQQLQFMLQTNTTLIDLKMTPRWSRNLNSFFTSVGAGLASNTTLKKLHLYFTHAREQGYFTTLFQGGLDRNIGLEELCFNVKDLSSTQDLVSALDRMAKNVSAKHRADGSHRVSTLKKLRLTFGSECNAAGSFKLVLECLVRNRAFFALEELRLDLSNDSEAMLDATLFDKLTAFVQAFPTLLSVRFWRVEKPAMDDSHLSLLADTLENNTTMTRFELDGLNATDNWERQNGWDPSDNPNHTRILCSVLRNKRQLPVLLEPSKRSLVPQALAMLMKSRESKTVQVVNLNHSFHLVQNLPELFSTDGMSGGGGGENVESVED